MLAPDETPMPDLTDTPASRARPRGARRDAADSVRASLRPEDWIQAATALLVDQGIDSVRVDVLAKRMGVTRGSFYWHFRDRDHLLSNVLQAWRNRATEQVTARFERSQADPRVLLHELFLLPFRGQSAEKAARIELAIRAWARRDAVARQAVDEADASRIAYIAQVFSALGFGIAQARQRAFLLYAYEVAESILRQQGSATQKDERRALMERLLLSPLPDGDSAPG